MNLITVQLLILAAAYVVAVVVGVTSTYAAWTMGLASKRMEAKKALGDQVEHEKSRISRLENEVTSTRELLDVFSKRLNRSSQTSKRRSSGSTAPDSDSPTTTIQNPEDILRMIQNGQG